MTIMDASNAIEPPLPRTRRRRRTREDVIVRIREAARQLFAERGYAFATTREIARQADVSETLLFRYYGDKATLFEEVVTEPFNRLMENFIALHPDPTDRQRDADARRFVRDVFTLFEDHQAMFRALLFQMPAEGRHQPATLFSGLDAFFEKSTIYAAQSGGSGFDHAVGVRLGFGMIASAVLFQQSLFPHGADRAALIATLEQMIANVMWRGASD